MVEKNLQTLFSAWVRANSAYFVNSTVWELKMEKGNAFAFDRVAEHQVNALLQAKREGLYHKISDVPVSFGGKMRFTLQKPCDCLLVKGADAYVVICFYKVRQPKETLWIDIEKFLKVKAESPRKSLTEAEAKYIAERIEVI